MSKISKSQIKNDAINSNLVKNESLKSEDIKDGTLVNADISVTAAIDLLKLSNAGAVNRSAIYHNGTAWVPLVKEYVNFYDSTGGQSFTGTITVDLDTARENSNTSVFSISNGEITVAKNGKFFISYHTSLEQSTNTRSSSVAKLEIDTGSGFTTIPGTDSYGYHRNNNQGQNTCNGSCLINLTSGDKIRLNITRYSGSATLVTIANASAINIIEL